MAPKCICNNNNNICDNDDIELAQIYVVHENDNVTSQYYSQSAK